MGYKVIQLKPYTSCIVGHPFSSSIGGLPGLVLVVDPPQWVGSRALVLCIRCSGNAGHSVVGPPLTFSAPMGPGLFSTWDVCLLGVLGVSHAWGALWFGAASISSHPFGL